ncbi:MAG: hypothetical protein R2824_02650 [Saprospiraceae bacterium]
MGIFQTEEEVASSPSQAFIGSNWRPGDIRYADLNGDGEINPGNETLDDPGDKTIIGNSTPRYSFGINLDLHYKNFSLTSFFQGIGKRDYWPSDGNGPGFSLQCGPRRMVLHYRYLDRKRIGMPIFRQLTFSTNTKQNLQVQSRYIQDASYIRLKNLTLSYNFSPELLSNIGLAGAQIYVAGMNLWEVSGIRKPLDPENLHTNVLSGENFNGAVEYPLQRIYSVGVNVTF